MRSLPHNALHFPSLENCKQLCASATAKLNETFVVITHTLFYARHRICTFPFLCPRIHTTLHTQSYSRTHFPARSDWHRHQSCPVDFSLRARPRHFVSSSLSDECSLWKHYWYFSVTICLSSPALRNSGSIAQGSFSVLQQRR